MLTLNQLIGFGVGGTDPITFTFVASATNTGSAGTQPTVTGPASIQANDLLVAWAWTSDAGGTAFTASGWSPWQDGAGNFNCAVGFGDTQRLEMGWKANASGSEAASSIALTNGSDVDWEAVMLVLRPSRRIAGITGTTVNKEINNNNPSLQTVSATAAPSGRSVLVFGCARTPGSTVSFSTASPAFDDTVSSSDSDMIVGYKIYNQPTAPSDHSIDMNDLGSGNTLWSVYITVTG